MLSTRVHQRSHNYYRLAYKWVQFLIPGVLCGAEGATTASLAPQLTAFLQIVTTPFKPLFYHSPDINCPLFSGTCIDHLNGNSVTWTFLRRQHLLASGFFLLVRWQCLGKWPNPLISMQRSVVTSDRTPQFDSFSAIHVSFYPLPLLSSHHHPTPPNHYLTPSALFFGYRRGWCWWWWWWCWVEVKTKDCGFHRKIIVGRALYIWINMNG